MNQRAEQRVEKNSSVARVKTDSSAAKVLATLELLGRCEGPMGSTAIARALDLDKANIHRILANLIELGYATKEAEGGRYGATLKLWEIGSSIIARYPLKRAAQPFLKILRDQTLESPFISIFDGSEVLYLDRLDAPYPAYAHVQVGTRLPACLTATGKALLAFQDDPELAYRRALEWHAPSRLADIGASLAELEAIRKQGYATSENAAFIGTSAVAFPILRRSGPPYAAVAVGGSSERFVGEHLENAIRSVRGAAVEISAALGDS